MKRLSFKTAQARSALHFFFLSLALSVVSSGIVGIDLSQAQLIQKGAPMPGPAVGRAAIAFNLQTIDGKAIGLETFYGKPLVMNFFASWCDPCREEMPLINDLTVAGAKNDFNVLGIAVEDSRAAITEYRREAKLVFPIALDLNNTVKRSYRIFGPPATFFIDSQGIIREVIIGPMTRDRAFEALKKTGVITTRDVR